MRKNIKYSLLAVMAVFGLASCGDEYEYTPAEVSDNAWVYPNQVYFQTATLNTSKVELSSDTTAYDIVIGRNTTEGETTLNVVFKQGAESTTQFVAPTTVTFADGEDKATISLAYDPTTIEYDDENADTLILEVPEGSDIYLNPASSKYLFTALIPSPWTSLGMGKLLDAFMYDDETFFDVEIQQNDLDPLLFRIVKPYDDMLVKGGYYPSYVKGGPSEFFEFYILPKGETLMGVQATQADYVYWNPVYTGYYIADYDDGATTDGEVMAIFPGLFSSLKSEEAWQFNKVLEYQANGLPGEIEMAPYYYINGVGGWNYTTKEGTIQILFPGYVKADYSINALFAGIMKTPTEENMAVVDFPLGPDVAKAKYALTYASVSEEDAAAAIISGELESTEITDSVRAFIPLGEDGTYRVTIVGYNADDEAKSSASCVFEFAKGGSIWESLGMCSYVDDFMTMGDYVDETWQPTFGLTTPTPLVVEVFAHTKTPGLYRIKNAYGADYPYNEEGDWDASMDYYLEIDATDPQYVMIQKQELGLDWGYGMFAVESDGASYVNTYPSMTPATIVSALASMGYGDPFGKLQDGIITFPAESFTVYMGEYKFYGNHNGGFRLNLNGVDSDEVKAAKFAQRLRGHKSLRVKTPAKRGMRTIKGQLKPVKDSVSLKRIAKVRK